MDVKADPIHEITATGLRTQSRDHGSFDAIVFATRFDAMTGALREIDIRAKGGAVLTEQWDAGPRNILG